MTKQQSEEDLSELLKAVRLLGYWEGRLEELNNWIWYSILIYLLGIIMGILMGLSIK